MRKKVILWGLVAAVVLRIGLAVVAVSLMADHRPDPGRRHPASVGVLAFLARHSGGDKHQTRPRWTPAPPLKRAILQIVLADISMSLDNVLAVAGAALGHLDVLVIGLLLSVALMGRRPI